jgi:hypothetical protein
MTDDPLATIVVTPRERYAVARRALATLVENTPENHRLVYVAPGAPAAIQQELAALCASRGYELIVRPDYRAPNPSRNLGLARVQTRYVVFLENDVVVERGWLEALVRCAEQEQADVVSPLCLIGELSERNVHSLGGTLQIENVAGKTRLQERHHCGPICLRTDPRRLTRIPADYSEFHCALVRRSVFDRMGPLDEQVLGAAEHIDLALHLRSMGCRGFAEPAAVVSYLPQAYTLADLDTYAVRWSDGWHFPTMKHLCEKWGLAPDSPLFHDYFSSFNEIRERCLLRQERPAAGSPRRTGELQPAQTIVQLLDQMQALGYPLEAVTRVRDAYGVSSEQLAGYFRASGRTFLAHVVGTASITAAFGANPAVIAAALLHANYAHGRFPNRFGEDVGAMRRWLRRRVGGSLEELVYLYSRLQLESVARYFPDRLDHMPIGLANAIVIRIANGIEDRLSGDHHYFDSAAWLEQSNAQIQHWMPAFTAIAGRLGMGDMAAILQDAVRRAQPNQEPHGLRPSRPLNYGIRAEGGAMQPLLGRNLAAADPDAVDEAGDGNGTPLDRNAGGLSTAVRRVTSADIKRLSALNEGAVAKLSDGVRVVCDQRPWAYSASLRLEDLRDATGPAEIQIRVRAERGTLGMMLLERGSSVHQIVPEQSVPPSADPVVVRFEIAALEEVGDLILRGWPSADGQPQAVIHGINVLLK